MSGSPLTSARGAGDMGTRRVQGEWVISCSP